MTHHYGIVMFNGVNCSFNRCTYQPVLYSENTASTDEFPFTCSLSFCSFANNNATRNRIFHLNINTGKKELKSCNIVDNSQE